MREITIEELEVVRGAWSQGDAIAAGTALGGGVGLSIAQTLGLSAGESLALAGLASAAGAGVTAAAIVGWSIGQAANEHTPVQDWISNLLRQLEDADGG